MENAEFQDAKAALIREGLIQIKDGWVSFTAKGKEYAKSERQAELARNIGETMFSGCDFAMSPLGRQGSFHAPNMPLDVNYLDEKMCEAAWWAPAAILRDVSEGAHIIDHAWKFGHPDRESFGFVTEPYISENKANAAVAKARKITKDWGLSFVVLPPELSSWFPGNCRPIFVTFEEGRARHFIRHALAWMLR